jgi:chemotaxis methyl-accepting protein methylase
MKELSLNVFAKKLDYHCLADASRSTYRKREKFKNLSKYATISVN